MYLFYIISDNCYDIIKFVEHLCEEIFNEINSVKNKSMFNKRRLSGSKGRWQKSHLGIAVKGRTVSKTIYLIIILTLTLV